MGLSGLLLIDKPIGPTSHDVVARIRRTLRERSIGHTGTLDPGASGLLSLVIGRATRLAPYLASGRKSYDATVRLGFATDTDDWAGQQTGAPRAHDVSQESITLALERFVGIFEQLPPAYSAKKIAGARAYDLARRSQPVPLRPSTVEVFALRLVGREENLLHLEVTCGPGFYVRALARDLGEVLECGGHLAALRRTASGSFSVGQAMPLATAERFGADLADHVLAPVDALAHLPEAHLTSAGEVRVLHGNAIGPEYLVGQAVTATVEDEAVRLLSAGGHLLAVARQHGGSLHPVVVLG